MSAATKTATPASPTDQVLPKDRQPELHLPPPLRVSTGKYPVLTQPLTSAPVTEVLFPPLSIPVTPKVEPRVKAQPRQEVLELPSTPPGERHSHPGFPNDPPQTRRKRTRAPEVPSGEVPPWLNLLTSLQRGSIPVTFFLVAGVLAVYAWSVYSQRTWNQAYRQLVQLQRQERELIAASETRKYQIAHQAESSNTGLVRQVPNKIVFLAPEPLQKAQPDLNLDRQSPNRLPPQSLMGY